MRGPRAPSADEHPLAAVAIAERAEVEDRRGEPERVADRDQASPVWLASNARPIAGSATFATARFRFATAATTINVASTIPWRLGEVERPSGAADSIGVSAAAPMLLVLTRPAP